MDVSTILGSCLRLGSRGAIHGCGPCSQLGCDQDVWLRDNSFVVHLAHANEPGQTFSKTDGVSEKGKVSRYVCFHNSQSSRTQSCRTPCEKRTTSERKTCNPNRKCTVSSPMMCTFPTTKYNTTAVCVLISPIRLTVCTHVRVYVAFKKAFYACYTVLGAATFESCMNQLKADYPEITPYFARHLDLHCEKWAGAFRHNVFTAGMNSTQRREAMSTTLKKTLQRKGRLMTVLTAVNSQLNDQAKTAQSREAIGAIRNKCPIAPRPCECTHPLLKPLTDPCRPKGSAKYPSDISKGFRVCRVLGFWGFR